MVSVYAEVMNVAREYRNASLVVPTFKFSVTDFVVGTTGHDPLNVRLARAPGLDWVDPNDGLDYLYGPTVLADSGLLPTGELYFDAVLPRGEASGDWSRIDLIATVTESPEVLPNGDPLPAAGEQFLFAVFTRPLVYRAGIDRDEYRFIVRGG